MDKYVIDGVGTLAYNETLNWYEGELKCKGDKRFLFLEMDDDEEELSQTVLDVLDKLVKNIEAYEKHIVETTSEMMVELGNDWIEDVEDEELTAETMAKRIQAAEYTIHPDGEITILCSDDDIFAGHAIAVETNIEGEIEDAYLAG